MKKRIVLLGPPASGKGTQAAMMNAVYHIEPTSPGAMLREELRAGTDLGKQADSYTSRGHLVPDPLVIALVGNWLKQHPDGFIFDGFPRTMVQARSMDMLLGMRKTPLEVVLYFNLPEDVIRERVLNRLTCEQCGRIFSTKLHGLEGGQGCPACGGRLGTRRDDTVEALWHRMGEYREKTEPLVEFYRSRELLREIAAAERPETVLSEISAVLEAI